MIITCGQCQTKFKVASGQIKDTGSKVRCSKCQHVFMVYYQKQAETNGPVPKANKGDKFLKNLGKASKGGVSVDSQEQLDIDLDSLSPKERRERRRRLYADLATQNVGQAEQGSDASLAGEDEAYPDEMPSLRRGRTSTKAERNDSPYIGDNYEDSSGDEYSEGYSENSYADDDSDYEDQQGLDSEGEYGYSNSREYEISKKQEAGLGSDPTDSHQIGKDQSSSVVIGAANQGEFSIRPALVRVKKTNRLLIGIAVVIAILAGSLYFLMSRPDSIALFDDEGGELAEVNEDPGDKAGTKGITFSETNSQAHYFRENKEVGKILIITGMVRNSYLDSRSFIKLRGILSGPGGEVLADRFIYAGNILTEDELAKLPILEIQSRLNVRSGRSGLNINVKPGDEIPFMLVFDKVPAGREGYSIDPVGSDPAK